MDADLVAEVDRLQDIYRHYGLQTFHYACLDGVQRARPDGRFVGNLLEIIGPLPRNEPLVA